MAEELRIYESRHSALYAAMVGGIVGAAVTAAGLLLLA